MATNPILRLCDSCLHFDGDSSCSAFLMEFPCYLETATSKSHSQQGDIIYEYDENRKEWFEMYRRVHPEIRTPIIVTYDIPDEDEGLLQIDVTDG